MVNDAQQLLAQMEDAPEFMVLGIAAAIYGVFGLICALIAPVRGRSAVAWFFIGIVGNCLAIILLLLLPDLKVEAERQRRREEETRMLRELLKKERQVSDRRHATHDERLTVHDRALGVDTALPDTALPDTALPDTGASSPPPPPVAEWFYAVDGKQYGPVAAADLQRLLVARELDGRALVWRDGMANWAAITEISELFDSGRGAG